MNHPRRSTSRLLLALALTGAAMHAATADAAGDFQVSVDGYASTHPIPDEQVFEGFGCHGGNRSPAVSWTNVPAGTQSFAVTLYDPDAPTGSGFWHWVVFDIPASAGGLPAGASASGSLPKGAIEGHTDFGAKRYGGPCPPAGDKPHRYVLTVHALKVPTLGLTPDATGALASFAARGNTLAKATATGRYGRPAAPAR